MLAFVAAAAAIQPVTTQSATKSETIFGCEYFKTDREAADGWVHQVDIRMVERADATWTVERGKEAPIIATPFPAQFGSVGHSVSLRWKDARGHQRTAYISFSDAKLPDGMQVFWLNFDRPSLWKAPGYFCQSMGDDPAEVAGMKVRSSRTLWELVRTPL